MRKELPQFSQKYHDSGRFLYDLIKEYSLARCLDIGLRGGLMTAYMTAIADSLETGRVVSLGLTSQKHQAAKVLDFMRATGLDRRLTVLFHKKSLSTMLLELVISGPAEAFDFVHVHSGPATQSMALIACLLERSVSPGGWCVIDGRPSSDEPQAATPTQIFLELLGRSRCFSTFRREGYFLLARKKESYWPNAQSESKANALLLGEALARSSEDLCFRLMLKDEPVESLLGLTGENPNERLPKFTDQSVSLLGGEHIQNGSLEYQLQETPWERKGRLESESRRGVTMATCGEPFDE